MRLNNYLSFSQYSTFLRSKEEYINSYINGFKRENKYMDFGKLIAYGLEERNENACEDVEIARQLISQPKEKEKKVNALFYNIPLFGILDGYDPGIIYEYKTGKNKWTQGQVDKNEQLTFYAIMTSIQEKIKPQDLKIKLIWLETFEDIDGSMHLSGQFKEFETKRTQADILRIYPKIKKVWIGIEELIDSL